MAFNRRPRISTLWLFLLAWGVWTLALQWDVAAFYYERAQLWPQVWRLWTGQWVHLGLMHLLLNVLALACLPMILVNTRVQTLIILLLCISPVLSVMLYVGQPHLQYYAGLSGVLHGIYIALALLHLQDQQERHIAGLVLLCALLKLTYEQWQGDSQTAALIGYPVIIKAHLYGAFLGLVFGGIGLIYQFKNRKISIV